MISVRALFALAVVTTIGLSSLPANAMAADGPVASLPPVERELAAADARARDCRRSAPGEEGVDAANWTAPMSGYVTVRLDAPGAGDWDLALFDKASGRYLGSSASFSSHELVQGWVQSGQTLEARGCRRAGGTDAATASFTLTDLDPPRSLPSPSLMRVSFSGEKRLQQLEQLGLDVTHHVHDGEADVIVAGSKQRDLLDRNGFTYETLIADMTRHYARSRAADASLAQAGGAELPSGQRSTYRTYEEVQQELKDLVAQHPGLVKPMTLPKQSFQGRPLDGIEIAKDVEGSDGRPVFFLVGMHHAREWPSVEAAMEFAWMLAKGYGQDQRITDLLGRERVVIVPVINADGYVSTRRVVDPVDQIYGLGFNPNLDNPTPDPSPDEHDLPTDCALNAFLLGGNCDARLSLVESIAPPGGILAYRRKNCDGAIPNPAIPCELQYGVDPNRNYGQLWGGNGSSGDRTTQTYRGTGPWSEPETQAVHEYSQTRQVTNIISLHNVAAMVLRPPGLQSQGFAPDEAQLEEVGDAMAEATGYDSLYGWELYDTTGTTEDWNYAAQGAFGYTIEIGPREGEFHMPYETGFVKEWNGETAGNGKGLREALLVGAEAAAEPRYHSVIEGKAPAGRTLRLKKSFDTFTSAFCEEEVRAPLLNYEHPIIGMLPYCVNAHEPEAIADNLETTMVVPASGEFSWHVNPSTRPFESVERREVGEIATEPSSVEEFSNEEETRPSQLPPEEGDERPTSVDRPFVVTAEEATRRLRVSLSWTGPADDYDLALYRRDAAGELQEVDTSGNPGPVAEEIVVEGDAVQPGEYVLRVTNYLALEQEWHATVERFEGGPDIVTPARREAWTLSCEDANGTVLEQQEVVVDRGQAVTADLACAGGGPGPDPDPGPGSEQRAEPQQPGSQTGSPGGQSAVPDRNAPAFLGAVRVGRGRIAYSLNESATVTFRVQRRVRGRWVTRGVFVRRSGAGDNSQRFRGRLGGRKLRAGSYRLVVVATDAAGNRSAAKRSNTFVVARPAGKGR